MLATASIAWILAVAAAAATAAAVGIIELVDGPISAFGGVIARPTLNIHNYITNEETWKYLDVLKYTWDIDHPSRRDS